MKSFKDFIKDAKDNFLIWSRLGMASSIRALYDRKTMLKNADISVSLLDKEETNQIDIGSKPKVNCQYYQVIGLPQTIAAHIVNDKIDVIVVVALTIVLLSIAILKRLMVVHSLRSAKLLRKTVI